MKSLCLRVAEVQMSKWDLVCMSLENVSDHLQ